MGGPIPQYTFRWTSRELEKTANRAMPNRIIESIGYPYWDFLEMRRASSCAAKLASGRSLEWSVQQTFSDYDASLNRF